MYSLEGMEIEVDVKKTLEILKNNRHTHRTIVLEAREGYINKAKEALEEKMEELLERAKKGKMVSLHFNLHVPQDHTNVYDTAISMLEMHTEETIIITPTHHRNLIEDKWDWTGNFYMTNVAYSGTAAATYSDGDNEE